MGASLSRRRIYPHPFIFGNIGTKKRDNMEQSGQEKEDFLAKVRDGGENARVMGKLNKGPVEVAVNEDQAELDMLELDELTIKANAGAVDESTDAGKQLGQQAQDALKKIVARREELEKKVMRAYLMPLQYRDSRIVQTAIAEALLSVEGMNFDQDTRIIMVLQEKKMMTVYLALRRFDNYGKRYYSTLEDIARVSDRTIDKLYETYVREFELTAEERKNL